MASFVYTPAKTRMLNGTFTFSDLRLALVMTGTTADTLNDAENLADVTMDETAGANYVRKAVTSEAVVEDLANDRAELSFSPVTWTALGNGSAQLEGIVLYQHVDGTAANDLLVAFIDPTGWPLNPGGADLTVTPNVEGVIQLT